MWPARSRTRFFELSCHGGASGLETSKTSGILSRGILSGFGSPGKQRPGFDFWVGSQPDFSMPGDDERKPGKPESPTGEREVREPPRDTRLPLADLLRRGISAGQAVSESLFPRELASSIASQLVDARHGLVNAIAIEVGRFLRQADIASEMRKVLAGLNVEAKIQLRFSEDERGHIKSEMDVERSAPGQRSGKTKPPPRTPPEE